MTQVTLENVSKSFNETVVISDFNLAIENKEFVVLVGPSGCGKTTTLRMIAGLEQASGGVIRFGERDVTGLRPGKRNCAMVFQNYALYPHMTVAQNITYGMRVRGAPEAEVKEALANAARILDLEPYLDRLPKKLSGGQRQRVAIGRALVRKPDVYLFDEPLSNLDAKLRIEMRVEIRDLHRRLGTTIVYVTHDQVEAMTMADRVVVMNEGRIEQAADPITLYREPANLFVAGFIGAPSMNFLPGAISQGTFTGADGCSFPIPPQRLASGTDCAKAVCGVRPEHILAEASGPAKVKQKVKVVEPLGPHTLQVGMVGDVQFTAQVPAARKVSPDDVVELGLDLDELHFFDAATGKVLPKGS
ncbi:MAG: sn-glycerol-3-phosphate ABC transporter ATP-binding protein UgpC [Betaproteobacteria bacterium AqS2]|uniref:Sn-glycerol-3-phosphate ABC transporter ATP-binding protein UgpC n=1 Tax=Candidatus Amphirhobacter heronislandensis TaxID=1732024 RepID=A0A930UFA9_9GAMM|nr:sn-glycerol-3-phosphate ABC transporter ATP-binding protein UgpC [Betaproteobacteria bacterium AqS2]